MLKTIEFKYEIRDEGGLGLFVDYYVVIDGLINRPIASVPLSRAFTNDLDTAAIRTFANMLARVLD